MPASWYKRTAVQTLALASRVLIRRSHGGVYEKTNPIFWFTMQLGMLAGFLIAYPVNGWLPSLPDKRKNVTVRIHW